MKLKNAKPTVVFVLVFVLLTFQNAFAQSISEPDSTIVGEGKRQRMTEVWNILPVDLNFELCQREPETVTGTIIKIHRNRDRTLTGFDIRAADGRTHINLDENLYNRLCIACLGHFYNFLTVRKSVTVEAYVCGSWRVLWAERIKESKAPKKATKSRRKRSS